MSIEAAHYRLLRPVSASKCVLAEPHQMLRNTGIHATSETRLLDSTRQLI